MVALIRYFKIARPLNLVIVTLIQIIVYYKILLPVFRLHGVDSVFGLYLFPIFVIVTVIVAASGNVINDIVDVEIDKVNKPDKWIVGNTIPVSNAYVFYYLLIVFGGLLAFVIATQMDKYYLLLIYVFAVFFLYLYSKYLKRVIFLGNLVVSLFSAGVIGVILIFEYETGVLLKSISNYSYNYIKDVFLGFMIFSFLSSMFREIVKDIEDIKGDTIENAFTIPLVFGIKKAKNIAALFALFILISLVYWTNMDINIDKRYLNFYVYLIVIPNLLVIMYLLVKARDKNQFTMLSKLIKSFMLVGIFMLCFYFV